MSVVSQQGIKRLAPGEGEKLWVLGDQVAFKADGERDGLTLFVSSIEPGGGPPPHVHHKQEEAHYVLEGTFSFLNGDEWIEAPVGTFIFIPRETLHTFRNSGTVTGRLLSTNNLPGSHERWFRFIVTSLERSLDFYTQILGFHITEDRRIEPSPRRMIFLSANDYHHQVALMEVAHFEAVPKGYAGLYHAAFLYPGPYELAVAVKHIVDQQYPIDACHDYGIGKFVNLRDPDGIPLELYYDYPADQWPRVDGQLRMTHRNVTIEELLQPLEQNKVQV